MVMPQYYYMIINNISKGVDWHFFRIFPDFFWGTAKFWSHKFQNIGYQESAHVNYLQIIYYMIFLHLEAA